MSSCEGCKFWSSLNYSTQGDIPFRCICLNEESEHHGKLFYEGCDKKEYGDAIDRVPDKTNIGGNDYQI